MTKTQMTALVLLVALTCCWSIAARAEDSPILISTSSAPAIDTPTPDLAPPLTPEPLASTTAETSPLSTVESTTPPTTPKPNSSATPRPSLVPVNADVRAEINKDPIITDADGGQRHGGEFHLIAKPSFVTSHLLDFSPNVQLIDEAAPALDGSRSILARVPEAELQSVVDALRTDPAVEAAALNGIAHLQHVPNDYYWDVQARTLGFGRLDFTDAWDVTTGPVRVAVLDSGVDPVPPDLNGRLDLGVNELTGVGDPGETSDIDPDSHGTKIAGIIGATQDNGWDIAGIAPLSRIVPVRVCGLTICDTRDITKGLQWVKDQNTFDSPIAVVNMSFTYSTDDPAVDTELSNLWNQNVILVGAAGHVNPIGYPARNPNVVAVSGMAPDGGLDETSAYGPRIDVIAPSHTKSIGRFGTPPTQDFNGTSASTAVISGLAALWKATVPIERGNLQAFLYDMSQIKSGSNARDSGVGFGVPNAFFTIWYEACSRFDFNHDHVIDISDDQAMAYHYGQFNWGPYPFDPWFDIIPSLQGDGETDISDLQAVFGRNGFHCPP